MNKIIKKLFYSFTWECAYRIIKDNEALPMSGTKYLYKVLNNKRGFWSADPFMFGTDNIIYCFCEYTDIKKHKSVIGVRSISPDVEEKTDTAYEFDGHTSYPAVFSYQGTVYMIPETIYDRNIQMLKCTQWPNKWEKVGVLLDNIIAPDTTPFIDKGQLKALIYSVNENDSTKSKLLIGSIDIENYIITDIAEIISYDNHLGRPGGNCIFLEDKLIRVVQPGNRIYGEKIEFYSLNLEDKTESKLGELTIDDIIPDKKGNYIGTHTFNRFGNVEIIDLLVKEFDFFKMGRYILQRLRLFGYDLGDKRKINYSKGKQKDAV